MANGLPFWKAEGFDADHAEQNFAENAVNIGEGDSLTSAGRHDPELGMRQSIFRSAARRKNVQMQAQRQRRGGGLKMDWTKPLPLRLGLWVLNRPPCSERTLRVRVYLGLFSWELL
jgi:hypothetical protein